MADQGTLGGLCWPPLRGGAAEPTPPLTQPSLAVAGAVWAVVALCEGPPRSPFRGLTQGKLGIASHTLEARARAALASAEVTQKTPARLTHEISVNPIVSPPKRTHTSKAETQSFVTSREKSRANT